MGMKLKHLETNTKIIIALSFVLSLIVMSPNIIRLISMSGHVFIGRMLVEGASRFLIIFFLAWILFRINLNKKASTSETVFRGLAFITAGFLISIFIHSLLGFNLGKMVGLLTFQFIVTGIVTSLLCAVHLSYQRQNEMAKENERLRIESLESRCDALANQINPHFFFNTLNAMSSLIREDQKELSLEYIEKLSVVFRYVLQSDRKGLVPLSEELDFLESYKFLLEVRYENKLKIKLNVADKYMDSGLPVLSLLPLVENVVKHNTISTDSPMTVDIMTYDSTLVISNPIHQKLNIDNKIGIGLKNLSNRLVLLTGKDLRTENDGKTFRVVLPLIHTDEIKQG